MKAVKEATCNYRSLSLLYHHQEEDTVQAFSSSIDQHSNANQPNEIDYSNRHLFSENGIELKGTWLWNESVKSKWHAHEPQPRIRMILDFESSR